MRLISKISEVQKNNTCVILGCESVECMRLEAGGMANMELIEQVVPNSFSTSEYDVVNYWVVVEVIQVLFLKILLK